MSKEHNFLSAVVYLENETPQSLDFLQTLVSSGPGMRLLS